MDINNETTTKNSTTPYESTHLTEVKIETEMIEKDLLGLSDDPLNINNKDLCFDSKDFLNNYVLKKEPESYESSIVCASIKQEEFLPFEKFDNYQEAVKFKILEHSEEYYHDFSDEGQEYRSENNSKCTDRFLFEDLEEKDNKSVKSKKKYSKCQEDTVVNNG